MALLMTYYLVFYAVDILPRKQIQMVFLMGSEWVICSEDQLTTWTRPWTYQQSYIQWWIRKCRLEDEECSGWLLQVLVTESNHPKLIFYNYVRSC